VTERDHGAVIPTARRLASLGFQLVATRGTCAALRAAGLEAEELLKVSEGRPNVVDAIRSGRIQLIVNTPRGESSYRDGWELRTAALQHNVPLITTLPGAAAAVEAIAGMRDRELEIVSLQELDEARNGARADGV